MKSLSGLSLDRVARSVHYRLGRYLDRRDANARRRSNDILARQIRQTQDKINVGCGYDKLPGYLNIDVDPACSPDVLIVANDDSMIPRRHFREVLAKDVLEHIPRPKTLAALLSWADYLADGGRLILQTSSILGVAAKLEQLPSFRDQRGWTLCLFGNQAHDGDFHFTGFTETTLRVHLLAAGFRVDAVGLRDEWLLTAEAVKTESCTELCNAGIGDDREFIREAYREALFRDAEEEEITSWVGALRAGAARKEVLGAIYASLERLFKIAERNDL